MEQQKNKARSRSQIFPIQFVRYCIVGASGFVVNMAVYSLLTQYVHLYYLAAAAISFCVAVTNNFVLNKYWTFGNPQGDIFGQAGRFLIISLSSLALNIFFLRLLVEQVKLHNLPAQAIAIALVTFLNYFGNKLWSFRQTTT